MKAKKFKELGWFLKTITLNRIRGISLAPFGIYIKKGLDTNETKRHEDTHWHQQIEVYIVGLILSTITQIILLFQGIFAWWFIPFVMCPFLFYYVVYLLEWFVRLFINGRRAYVMLSFEREARFCAGNLMYKRKRYDWLKYY